MNIKLESIFFPALLLSSTEMPARVAVQGFEQGLLSTMLDWSMKRRVAAKFFAGSADSPGKLRGCEKMRSWFDTLTTSGVAQYKFKYLAARPEPVEGQRLIFSQPLR